MKRMGIIIALVMTSTACGSGAGLPGPNATAPGTGSGRLQLVITGSKSFNPNIVPGQISQYQITVTGADFAPIQVVVPGDATEANVTGIPVGAQRAVQVLAFNPNAQVIRAGEAADVSVQPDAIATLPIHLDAVPIVTNVADGAIVPNTRLRLKLFSDPASLVEITAEHNGATQLLLDVSGGLNAVATDASTGVGQFLPTTLAPGDYTLTVRDTHTGRSSQVNVRVTDGLRERGMPLSAGGRMTNGKLMVGLGTDTSWQMGPLQ